MYANYKKSTSLGHRFCVKAFHGFIYTPHPIELVISITDGLISVSWRYIYAFLFSRLKTAFVEFYSSIGISYLYIVLQGKGA